MEEALYSAVAALLLAIIGWFTSWIKSKAQGKVIDVVVTAIENVDEEKIKRAVNSVAKMEGVKDVLDAILAKKGLGPDAKGGGK